MEGYTVNCPVCKKEVLWKGNAFRPFCSDRCRLVDLGEWASEKYRIAGEKKDGPEETSEENNPGEL